jgi:hypothetical protein
VVLVVRGLRTAPTGKPLSKVFLLLEASLQVGNALLELGDAPILLPAFLPPAVPDPALELDRTLEDPPVLGLDTGALLRYPPLRIFHTPPV